MKYPVVLSIRGEQKYQEQEPDSIELITDGYLEQTENGWEISYEETDLTGLAGVTTSFRVEPGTICLTRTGKLNSQMVFSEGVFHESLYRMEFGALMVTVCASKVAYEITPEGGFVDLVYAIEIEQSAAGLIIYHLDIRAK